MRIIALNPAPRPGLIDCPGNRDDSHSGCDTDGEIRRRVGAALDISPDLIEIEQSQVSSAGLNRRSTGKARGTRFFAKTYLVDSCPIPAHFSMPGEELQHPAELYRPVEEHVATEWMAARKIRSLLGSNSPAPLGCSLQGRTLVFEEVKGTRGDHLVRWAWPGTANLRAAEKALFRAGAWLRNLHDASFREYALVEPLEVLEAARQLISMRGVASTLHGRLALQEIESACHQIGPQARLQVPVTLNHGDFSLPNLLWDRERERLWVLDYELSSCRPILHDLGMMIFDLRRHLLHPRTWRLSVRRCERAFWSGYGVVSPSLLLFVDALATARLFSHSLPRISTLRDRRGWTGGLMASVYKTFLQPLMIARIMRIQRSREP